ncbi:MAG: adenylate/guanylate cyclase domain-containing protein [Pseudanabaenaceae cyanobacterium bins.39]|nr:adenylate/guanylate cyclase domain-containing protein [Pseudanabaenaceae cyanobacterium bins.39]
MTTPFVILTCLAVLTVGHISLRIHEKSITEFANHLSTEVGEHVSKELDNYLRIPKQINQINADAFKLGILKLNDFEVTGKFFWKQLVLYPVGYINFAFTNQEFIGAERQDNGQILINETTQLKGLDKTVSFMTDANGDRQQIKEEIINNEDVRQEGWYADAVKAGKPTWSSVYQWIDRPHILSISHSYPLYDRDQNLIGVLGVDYILSQFNSFLQKIAPKPSSHLFIIESSGLVVATSDQTSTFNVSNGNSQRLNILNSNNFVSREVARYIVNQFGGFTSINDQQLFQVYIAGEKQFVLARRWMDVDGLDWLIVVILPESAFVGEIHEYIKISSLVGLVALIILMWLGIVVSRSISKPLLNMSTASQELANGQLDSRVSIQGTKEIQILAKSFNQMADMLTDSFKQYEKINLDLEVRVHQRTSELADSQLSLQRNNFMLLQREQKLRKQQKTLVELTKNKFLNLGDFMSAVQSVTQAASITLDVERVGVWLFGNDKSSLQCLDLYIKSQDLHTEANLLESASMPDFFEAIRENRDIAVEDVESEPYLFNIYEQYLHPHGVVSILLSTFDVKNDLTGVLMIEQIDIERLWIIEEISFVSSLADLLSLGLEAQERRRAEEKLRIEQVRSERLLLNVLPKAIAERLKSSPLHLSEERVISQMAASARLKTNGSIVADSFESVSVLFADIVGFTEFATVVSATELVDMLNDIFSEFDRLADEYNLEKIKTIGDSYMVVGGLPIPRANHVQSVADMALAMQSQIDQFSRPNGESFQLRIGIHTGQAVAGVIGKKKFIYDLWGDTVNIASRMESYGLPNHIQVTEETYQILKNQYMFEQRGTIQIKGKGAMNTYWLKGKLPMDNS